MGLTFPSYLSHPHTQVISVTFLTQSPKMPGGEDFKRMIDNGRKRVVLAFYQNPIIESFQAVLILATERIAQGRPLRGWTLIGTLNRASVQCGLNEEWLEPDYMNDGEQSLQQAINMLTPPTTPIEAETRRRVFWVRENG